MCACAHVFIHLFLPSFYVLFFYVSIYIIQIYILYLSISLYNYLSIYLYIYIIISYIYYSSVKVTKTTVSSGDAILTCICVVATVNNKPEDLTSNIIWSPNTGTPGATLRTNSIYYSYQYMLQIMLMMMVYCDRSLNGY